MVAKGASPASHPPSRLCASAGIGGSDATAAERKSTRRYAPPSTAANAHGSSSRRGDQDYRVGLKDRRSTRQNGARDPASTGRQRRCPATIGMGGAHPKRCATMAPDRRPISAETRGEYCTSRFHQACRTRDALPLDHVAPTPQNLEQRVLAVAPEPDIETQPP